MKKLHVFNRDGCPQNCLIKTFDFTSEIEIFEPQNAGDTVLGYFYDALSGVTQKDF